MNSTRTERGSMNPIKAEMYMLIEYLIKVCKKKSKEIMTSK